MPLTRQELLNRLSPFEFARYEGNFPDTRALQIGFIQRVIDTYRVYHGGTDLFVKKIDVKEKRVFSSVEAKTTPGLIDYATLGTFRLIHAMHTGLTKMMFAKWKPFKKSPHKTTLNKFVNAGLWIPKLLFLAAPYIAVTALHMVTNGLIRKAAAAILTIASLLPIVISHGIAKKVQSSKANKLALQPIEIHTKSDENGSSYEAVQDRNQSGPVIGALPRTTEIANITKEMFDNKYEKTYRIVSFKKENQSLGKYYALFKVSDRAQMANYETLIKVNPTAREKDSSEVRFPARSMSPRGSRNNGW